MNACRSCALPLKGKNAILCVECIRLKPWFYDTFAYGVYEGALKEAIKAFKYPPYAKRLAKPFGEYISGLEIPLADFIVPVPLTKKRLIERGFNQSYLLSKAISIKSAIPLRGGLLVKTKDTGQQAHRKGKERRLALRDVFSVKESIDKKHVLLVDDVMTTGTTLNECAKALIVAGAKRVTCVVLARAVF